MLKISETIVVEGKGDASNIARVCDANFIITSGLHISKKTYQEIELAVKTSGIIIFTDPDSAGRSIRNKIVKLFGVYNDRIKHANITIKEAKKNGDVGVENACDEAIIEALMSSRAEREHSRELSPLASLTLTSVEMTQKNITIQDLMELGLAGSNNAAEKRRLLCDNLRIPYSNAKSLVRKLNTYHIDKSDIINVINNME